MPKTEYAGIDYSLGMSNVDRETGIHYGVISQHAVNPDALGDIEAEYGDPHCPECGARAIESSENEIVNEDWNEGKDYACPECQIVFWSDAAFPEEPIGLKYEREGYLLTDCLDSDLFVLKSQFYTHAQYCSPCVPGAGNLESPCADGPKTYALGHDWFEDGRAPYRVFRVSDDAEVIAELQSSPCQNCKGTGRDTIARVAEARGVELAEVRESISAGKESGITGFDADTNTFHCFRCDGSGKVEAMVEIVREVQR